jgi:hypothetical protein
MSVTKMSAHELDDGKCPLRDRTTISKHSRRSQAALAVSDESSALIAMFASSKIEGRFVRRKRTRWLPMKAIIAG